MILCAPQFCQCLRVYSWLYSFRKREGRPFVIFEFLPLVFRTVLTTIILKVQVRPVWSYVAKIISVWPRYLAIFVSFFLRGIVVLSLFYSPVLFEFVHHIIPVVSIQHHFSAITSVHYRTQVRSCPILIFFPPAPGGDLN